MNGSAVCRADCVRTGGTVHAVLVRAGLAWLMRQQGGRALVLSIASDRSAAFAISVLQQGMADMVCAEESAFVWQGGTEASNGETPITSIRASPTNLKNRFTICQS